MQEQSKKRSSESVLEAKEVIEELRTALERNGIVLPSLGPDALFLAAAYSGSLVELGRCTVETARRLAAVLPEEGGR
ncbi:hypothetical protein ABZO31_10300 [Streptomyces sp. HUAS MG47]|uniref:hypothetical protein n=1 Tax=Streptomyces solicamelliae TaxID=3231716 RepID=UPI00387822FD